MGRLLKFNAHDKTQIFCKFRGCKKKATAPMMFGKEADSQRVDYCPAHAQAAANRIDAHTEAGRKLFEDILAGTF